MKLNVGKKRLLIWGALGALLVVLLVLALMPRPVPADLAETSRGSLRVTLDHEGKTRVRERYVISAPLAGRVRRIVLEPGDPVVANQTILVTFEPREPDLLDSRSRAEAQAAVKSAEASLAQARAERQRAEAELDFADSELKRHRQLAERGIVSEQQLDSAQTQARARREALQAAESAQRSASFELEAARARLLEPAGNGIGNSRASGLIELRSPVDGVVLRRLRESEAVVPMGEALLEVADPADLEVVADYLSTDAVKMREGMAVLIDQWGGDRELRGRVRRVEPSGFMKISALGVEEQRVNVVVDFDDPREAWEALGDEYRVEVRVVVWEGQDVLRVPTSSLFRHGESWAVFVVDGGRARLRPIRLGQRTGLSAEVAEGLDAGETVVIHPSDAIQDDVRIAPR